MERLVTRFDNFFKVVKSKLSNLIF